jgi:cell shape-determining protein MreC
MTVQAIDSPLASGDLIFTTGFSPLIPRGIPIGRVISVENLQEIGATRARVLPIANVGSLREVVIIR